MTTTIIGFPRVGAHRELKFATEKFFRGEITADELRATGAELRADQWKLIKDAGIDQIPSGDFSFYDQTLDAAALFGLAPKRYRDLGLDSLETYFAQARGYQGNKGDVKALPMKKWFNTNYHYIEPEIEPSETIALTGTGPLDQYREAKELGIDTRPVIVGPFTLFQLAKKEDGVDEEAVLDQLAAAYGEFLERATEVGASWVQLDEPSLVVDLTDDDLARFTRLYEALLAHKGGLKVLVQTYFGNVRDSYTALTSLPIDGIGLDFVEGRRSLELLHEYGFPEDKVLYAGVVNGKNIWRNDFARTQELLSSIRGVTENVVLTTSCSLLHVPYTVAAETDLDPAYVAHLAFAVEKLGELVALNEGATDNGLGPREDVTNRKVQERVAAIADNDYTRSPAREERDAIQRREFNLPPLPTTTIGSFPQTKDVKATRKAYKQGDITVEEYTDFNKKKIAECVAWQDDTGLDVIVHGEYERNDMVEYFGQHLDGFLFTRNGWVQSYGTRCVKPPLVWGDVSRPDAITVDWSAYAQSLTDKPVKGMLTGPVTILNWSFPREDITIKESILQIALAIRDEVLDLEKAGIRIIQVDEAALREKLPLRRSDWFSEYLDFAIPAFRLVHSGVAAETQIHTHMCYSQFTDILPAIDALDADVITFEASRSDLEILDALVECDFRTNIGPGVYDIHSPRVPSTEEIVAQIKRIADKIDVSKLWVNPDCGLKTRGEEETRASLINLVAAARQAREELA
ncbi:5-methyltetrahydropteroyltriglutamate--homocysteine S-methyltransferase [Corynebacterium glucuronolyticum]|uniref:5-methyltetrahydropteroyltriglutamate--homocysteine methyltransferase n=1 Tax=Corynebacterium glucuronolyticum TaxID=39791 RepID=A0A7T4EFD5_9CORY|nr:5-methyltetrahydropteroyltriglutamate--homocysteine S-methyltransferase [Corynebacterium glucuronolyticum]QQB46356.1 5-methyltetrahydropteroyltriglutamate--homocysteine S-methyltransferase [Corynebacterium glucuronolyticum]WKD62869.1 5-methyltetrahydropteroyltriglutamate--homocysteine methyltransferase [Corynebacterium glucuronolyticum DSM 44120]SMB84333.1 methionine synthase (B12-independent) [Corynebacterium glucuronolyticum]